MYLVTPKIKQISKYLETHSRVTSYGLLVTSLLFFSWLAWSPTFPDPDSFYHIKIAQIIRDQKSLVTEFPWLPLTILEDSFADQSWLYHVILVPFTYFTNPLVGLKVATVLLSTALIMTLYGILKKMHIKYAWGYILILLLTNPFIFRISLAKTTAISVTIFLIGLYLLTRRNELQYTPTKRQLLPLFILSLLFVWTHAAWPLLVIAAIIYWIVSGIYTFKKNISDYRLPITDYLKKIFTSITRTPERTSAIAVILGSITGLIINPTFPENLKFFWYQTVLISVRSYKYVVDVGSEWYGFAPSELIGSSVFIAIMTLLALITFIATIKKQTRGSWTILIMSSCLFFLTLKSRRNSEYLLPNTLIFVGLTFKNAGELLWSRLCQYMKNWLHEYKKTAIILALYMLTAIPFILIRDTIRIKGLMAEGVSIDKYKNASAWMKSNITPGSTVFHTAWEDFPVLFYHNSDFRYIIGLDPTFLYLKNPETYTTWHNIQEGIKPPDQKNIAYTFNTNTLVIEKNHETLHNKIQDAGEWALQYEDDEVWIYMPQEHENTRT